MVEPMCLLKNEKGAMVWVVLSLLTLVVIAAGLVMLFMPGTSTSSPTSPPAVVKMKVPSAPKAEPEKVAGLQPPPGVEKRNETSSDPLHVDTPPAEPDVDTPAALSSTADAPDAAGTVSARAAVTDEADSELPSANAEVPAADAASPAQQKFEAVFDQGASADHGEPVQTAMLGVAEDVVPGATSESANDLFETEATAAVAAEAPEAPASKDRPEPSGAATAPENEASFTVQVGAFHTQAYADAQLEKLKGFGYPAYIFEVMDKKQRPLYLVCFGRFQTLAEAGDTMSAFTAKQKMPAVVARPWSW